MTAALRANNSSPTDIAPPAPSRGHLGCPRRRRAVSEMKFWRFSVRQDSSAAKPDSVGFPFGGQVPFSMFGLYDAVLEDVREATIPGDQPRDVLAVTLLIEANYGLDTPGETREIARAKWAEKLDGGRATGQPAERRQRLLVQTVLETWSKEYARTASIERRVFDGIAADLTAKGHLARKHSASGLTSLHEKWQSATDRIASAYRGRTQTAVRFLSERTDNALHAAGESFAEGVSNALSTAADLIRPDEDDSSLTAPHGASHDDVRRAVEAAEADTALQTASTDTQVYHRDAPDQGVEAAGDDGVSDAIASLDDQTQHSTQHSEAATAPPQNAEQDA